MSSVDSSGRSRPRRGLVRAALTALVLPLATVTPAHAASVMVYTNPGNPTFTVPAGVTAVTVHVVGAGGG
ncbi:hypothetical protein J7S33_28785, partial [Saccharothrix algeriensis]